MMEQSLAEYVVNALWQVPLLAGGGWLLLRVAKPGPQTQHRIWLAILALCVLLPLRGMDTPGVFPTRLPSVTMIATDPATHEDSLSRQRPWFASLPHLSLRTHTVRLNATTEHWLVRLYLATVVFSLVRLARSWSASRRLVADAQETSRHNMALAYYSRRFRVELPQVRESQQVSSPMVVGAVAPVLLLPEGFFRLTEDEVRATLCHELAHVQRRDYLMNLLCQVAALPVAWHPVVSQVQQGIRTTREMVCDAMAAQEMKSHIGYARCLLALANSMLGGSGLAEQRHVGLFTHNTLEKRVMLLVETTRMTVQARVARAATGTAAMIVAGTLAAMFHVTPTMAEPAMDVVQPPLQTVSATAQAKPLAANPAPEPAAVKRVKKRRAVRKMVVDQEPEQRSENIQRDLSKTRLMLESPNFKQQIENADRQAANIRVMIDSPEFQQQMEEMQRQMANVTVRFDKFQFKKQIDEAQRQTARVRVMVESPKFKRQIEEAQRQTARVRVMVDSPEFQRQMEEVQRQMVNVKVKLEGLMAPCAQDGNTPVK